MSATVIIENKKIFGKKPTLNDILGDNLSYGVMDEYYRLNDGNTGDYTVIYSRENIGRGFEVCFMEKSIELHLPYPNSVHDIELFHMTVVRLCKLCGTRRFDYDGQMADINQIEHFIQRDISTSVQALEHEAQLISSGKTGNVTLFGACNPLSIGIREVERFGGDVHKFGEWLNEKQQLDAYYAVPHFYLDDESEAFGVFAIAANVVSIIPIEAKKPMGFDDIEVNNWYVYLAHTGEETAGRVSYDRFIEYVNSLDNVEYYDDEHVVINLTEDDVNKLVSL